MSATTVYAHIHKILNSKNEMCRVYGEIGAKQHEEGLRVNDSHDIFFIGLEPFSWFRIGSLSGSAMGCFCMYVGQTLY